MRSQLRLGKNNRGDTIVEVLLAIAVVSAVLAGAYVSANLSLGGARQAQERGEALKYVEGQLETLKEVAARPDSPVFSQSGTFCFDDGLAIVSAPCTVGPDGRYQLSIQPGDNEFTARAEWERVGGGATEHLEIVYRVYEGD